jgi:hypothetical protein
MTSNGKSQKAPETLFRRFYGAVQFLDKSERGTPSPPIEHHDQQGFTVFEMPVKAAFGYRKALCDDLDPYTIDAVQSQLVQGGVDPRIAVETIYRFPRFIRSRWNHGQIHPTSARAWHNPLPDDHLKVFDASYLWANFKIILGE